MTVAITSRAQLHEAVLTALRTGAQRASQVTILVYGPFWSEDEAENVQRALGDLSRDGRVRCLGIEYAPALP